MRLRIGNGCGFYGDQLDAPRRLVEAARLDYLTLEYLAELTLSILARVKEKDPERGYADDFLHVVRSLESYWVRREMPTVVTNAGGMNPAACARATGRILSAAGRGDLSIGVVEGDDISSELASWLEDGVTLDHLDTGEPISGVLDRLVSANVYLGAGPIVEALRQGAEVVITGRVADASLTVAPARHRFGWDDQEWNRLASAAVAGHLIECGAQVTGGYATTWQGIDLIDVGYPIAELDADGSVRITKPNGTGGVVDRRTVSEQLIYEIGDPASYITPDVVVDFTSVSLGESGPDCVEVRSARGRPAPGEYKVSAAYRDGYMAAGELVVWGPDAVPKASAVADIIVERTRRAGCRLDRVHVENLGRGGSVPGFEEAVGSHEVVLRIAASSSDRASVERFRREFAPIVTSGPAGVGGYTTPPQRVRPIYAFWPTLIPRERVDARVSVTVRSAAEWAER